MVANKKIQKKISVDIPLKHKKARGTKKENEDSEDAVVEEIEGAVDEDEIVDEVQEIVNEAIDEQEAIDANAILNEVDEYTIVVKEPRRRRERDPSEKKYLDWQLSFCALKKYGEEHGHCNVPKEGTYGCVLEGMGEEGTDVYYEGNLGLWLKNQRCMRRGTRGKLRLSPERESQLQGLVDQGLLLWDAVERRGGTKNKVTASAGNGNFLSWPCHYAALQNFGQKYGHCNVPIDGSYECELEGMSEAGTSLYYSGKLGIWLKNQRSMKRGKRGKQRLTPERDALLQALVDQGLLLWDASEKRGGGKVKSPYGLMGGPVDNLDPMGAGYHHGLPPGHGHGHGHGEMHGHSHDDHLVFDQMTVQQISLPEGDMCHDERDAQHEHDQMAQDQLAADAAEVLSATGVMPASHGQEHQIHIL